MTKVAAITRSMLTPIRPGDVDVLGGGADRDAEARAIDEPREAGHHHHRQQDDGDLHAADGGPADGEARVVDDLRKGQRIAAPGQQREVLQDDGHADRGDQRRQARRVAQRAVGDALQP
jgi:hypothetical protein